MDSKSNNELRQLRKISEAARDTMWEPDAWESYQDMKSSISASIPTEFMRLGELVEAYYGSPFAAIKEQTK